MWSWRSISPIAPMCWIRARWSITLPQVSCWPTTISRSVTARCESFSDRGFLYCRLQSAEEPKQHRPSCRLARYAGGVHGDRHRALDFVVIKLARGVAIRHPRALHGLRFGRLITIERIEQAFVVIVEQTVPDRVLDAVAVDLDRFGGTSALDAALCDKVEQAPPFALIQIILVLGRAIPDRRDFIGRGL